MADSTEEEETPPVSVSVETPGESIRIPAQGLLADGYLINTVMDTSVTGSLVAENFQTISGWSWEFSAEFNDQPYVFDEEQAFSVSPGGTTTSVTFNSDYDIMPLEEIRYLDPTGNENTIQVWDDLPVPEDSPEMTVMREGDTNLLQVIMSVTVSGTNEDGGPDSASGDFSIFIFKDYDISKNLLSGAVEDRLNVL